ncbi:hypothetical protein ULMA_11340 [Patiriisocius marinus]|uniref:Uncharacterized protein n=1 Tax=Patiriisocius marinus TaxID=1397112 RepID=A0A5J4IVY9_9FLAO|nr:hypothetical protein [Patiriisocius marinus]GER59026.1 hypothetical protein ULMA_11340 [Patiriisocius marinus]
MFNISDAGDYIGEGEIILPDLISRSQNRVAESAIREIPIKIWIYRMDNGSGNTSVQGAFDLIDDVNILFEGTNIQLYPLCDVTFIDDTEIATNGGSQEDFEDYTLINRLSNALNMHFVISHNEGWGGKANFPDDNGDGNTQEGNSYSFALRLNSANSLNRPNIVAH